MLQQRINKRYCDKKRMNDFLVANFGQNGFEVEAKSEVYILTVPRELTEASRDRELSDHALKQVLLWLAMAELIEDRILDLQVKNFESAHFIPIESLEQVLIEPTIQDVVAKCGVDVQKRVETISVIQSGAKKIFAILILMRKEILIRHFIEHDQFQTEKLDAKLPMSVSWLQTLIGEKSAKLFCQKQWMFVAPYFRNDLSHRNLENDVILPFTASRYVGSGGFGTVFEVTLDPAHQGIRVSSVLGPALSEIKLIRKQIELSESTIPADLTDHKASHPNEGDILSILRLVKHPSIVRLVTTFSHRGSYSLLFPPAESDLFQLLARESRPPDLQTDDLFLVALQGLSSALATLHEFSACDFDLELIGCHHDLKPSNILVDRDKFLLADFGLSRIRSVNSDSNTMFKGADSNYIAPESEISEKAFERALVGRKSDIWALGCILIEVLTYMVMGPHAIQRFEEGRRAKVMNWVLYQFHNGGKPSSFVNAWIDRLEQRAHTRFTGVFSLIRTMLEIDPSRRPDASEVSSKLSFVSLRSQYASTVEYFEDWSGRMDSFSVLAETERLKLWASAIGLDVPEGSWKTLTDICGDTTNFQDLCQSFSNLTDTVNMLGSSKQHDQSFNPAFRQLRRHVDRLCSFLPQERRDRLDSALEMKLLSGNDLNSLWKMQAEFEDLYIHPNVRHLAIAKYMSLVSNAISASGDIKKFSLEEIDVEDDFGAQSSLASISKAVSKKQSTALIEWLEYDLQWAGDVGQELFVRIEAIAELLHQSPKPSGFRSLDCLGYYHEARRHSFGLVFELPAVSDIHGDSVPPKTLSQLIRELRVSEERPLLGNVFKLAHTLSSSVLEFHKVGWLHKNISSFNIAFFPGAFESAAASVIQPYLIGFNHSRPDEPDAFTHGPDHNPEQRDYSHPEYLKDESRFQCIHDYYSLGIVLLEIGLWRTLSSLAASLDEEDQSPENLRHFLIRNYVPRLGNAVGEIYQKAVLRCLTSDFGDAQRRSNSTADNFSLLSAFDDNVVVSISRCCA